MESIGSFVPVEQKGGDKFVYIIKHASRGAAAASWDTFQAEDRGGSEWLAKGVISDWKSVFSCCHGLFARRIPALGARHVYELRTYTCNEGKLDAIDTRFREHTQGLFAKHGMTNVPYTPPLDEVDGAGHTLVCLLGHDSPEAARSSFDSFGQGPEWIQVRDDSEAAGKLLVNGGVESLMLKPLLFSALQ